MGPMEPRPGSSAALFEKLGQLRKNWIKGGWSWDSRYSCVASSFNNEMEPEARAVVLAYLPHEWNVEDHLDRSRSGSRARGRDGRREARPAPVHDGPTRTAGRVRALVAVGRRAHGIAPHRSRRLRRRAGSRALERDVRRAGLTKRLSCTSCGASEKGRRWIHPTVLARADHDLAMSDE